MEDAVGEEGYPRIDVGAAGYRAPEVLFRAPSFGTPVDIWSLGVTVAMDLAGPPWPRLKWTTRGAEHPTEIEAMISMMRARGKPPTDVTANWATFPRTCPNLEKQPWSGGARRVLGSTGLQILDGMLAYAPGRRATAAQILLSPFVRSPLLALGNLLPKTPWARGRRGGERRKGGKGRGAAGERGGGGRGAGRGDEKRGGII